MEQKIIGCLFLLLTNLSFSAPIVEKTQTFYTIKGENPEDLRQQMNTLGPTVNGKPYDAQTTWSIKWQYSWQPQNSSPTAPCVVKDVQIYMTLIQLLPKWSDQNLASQTLQTKWNNFLAALEHHEQKHESNGMEAAQQIETTLLKMPPMPSCPELVDKIERTAKGILRQYYIWDKKIDTDSNYGKKEGAAFP
jgi:predicted secreted Zn-dependent protease